MTKVEIPHHLSDEKIPEEDEGELEAVNDYTINQSKEKEEEYCDHEQEDVIKNQKYVDIHTL